MLDERLNMPPEIENSTPSEGNTHMSELESVPRHHDRKSKCSRKTIVGDPNHETIRWNEVHRENVQFETFTSDPECRSWMKQLVAFVTTMLGSQRTTKVFSYISGGDVYLAVDVFNSYAGEYVAITALMTGDAIYLAAPGIRQFDIALPNIADGFYLINALLSPNQDLPAPEQPLFFYQPDRRVA